MFVSQLFAEFQAPGSIFPHATAVALFLALCAYVSIRLHAKPAPVMVGLQWIFAALLTWAWLDPKPDSLAWAIPAVVSGLTALVNTVHRPDPQPASNYPTYSTQPARSRRKTSTSRARIPRIPQLPR